MSFWKVVQKGKKLTKKNFKSPPPEMGIIPFWFWNGELKEKELEWQMKEYRDRGIRSIILHGRFGLKVPYLSDGWFDAVKFVYSKAEEIGLDIWVYDEMNWPSGTAERKVPQRYPHLKQKYLEMVILDIYGPLFTFLEATDNRYINTGNAKPIAAYACAMEEFESGIKHIIDLTPNLSFNAVIPWEAPEGKWKLLYFLEKEVDYYIDALNPESTRKFLDLTHEQYRKTVGKSFGHTLPGFYTDEPAMHYYHVGLDNYVIPWSAQMFKIFRKRRGYDLKPHLPALYTNMGSKTARIRHDFWRTLTEQYAESYYKQIRDWCEKHKVLFTGHLLLEDRLRLHARCEGNIFKHLKHMHITGVDHLYPVVGTEETPEEHVALKLASSASHHFGSTRLLCESMGGSYWDCTLERMKWIANWEYVLGVTIFNNHGYHYSIEGERKRDWPPSQFYHHTWWKYYDQFTTYMSRLGHVLSGGRHVAKVLILYPIDSLWANYVPQKRDQISEVTENDFYYLTDTLLRLHYDYDYVDEDILAGAEIKKGRICIRDEKFELLILPPLTHIKAGTLKTLKKFVSGGGKIIADTLIPFDYIGSNGRPLINELKKIFGLEPLEVLKKFQQGAAFKIHRADPGKQVYTILGKGLFKERKKKKLAALLETCVTPDVTVSNKDVFYLHRIKDDHDIYFFVNTQQKDQGDVEISLEKDGRPELWDPVRGGIKRLAVYHYKKGRITFTLNFPPASSHLVVLTGKTKEHRHVEATNLEIHSIEGNQITGFAPLLNGRPQKPFVSFKGKKIKKEIKPPLKNIKLPRVFDVHFEQENTLAISEWKMRLADESDLPEIITALNYNDSKWLDVTLGAWEMQLPAERDEEVYPVTLWYRASFDIETIPPALGLMIDGFSGSKYRLFINGNEIKSRGRRSYLDAEIRRVEIGRYVKTGKNLVAVQLVVQRRTDGILDILKITGHFSLKTTKKGYRISSPLQKIRVGDWTEQGYPWYSGSVCYTTVLNIPEKYLNGKLLLHANCAEDVCEVKINDGKPSIMPWHPYRLDISSFLRPGKNKISLTVTNTLINILEAQAKSSGFKNRPFIEHQHHYIFDLEERKNESQG